MSVEQTLVERGNRYGLFVNRALLSQNLTDRMKDNVGWNSLAPHHKESLEMIQHKIARIINGDPNYDDSWRDIAGYAMLIVKQLNGESV